MSTPANYRVFKRSARKYTVARGLTLEEARSMCADFNDNRTPSQVARGTKCEFEQE